MKKLYTIVFVLCLASALSAQCVMQVSCNWVTCFGGCDGSATAYVVNATPPYTFQWMPGNQTTQTIIGLCAGTYTCVMIDSLGCTATAQCTVGSPQQLQAMITTVIPPSCPTCCDGSATGTATGGTPPYTFMWGPPPTPSATMNGMCVGTYTFCVFDANGCQSCITLTQQTPQTIVQTNLNTTLRVYPNPASPTTMVKADFGVSQSGEVVVSDLFGRIVSRRQFTATEYLQMEIDLSGEPCGMYIVQVITEFGTNTTNVTRQ